MSGVGSASDSKSAGGAGSVDRTDNDRDVSRKETDSVANDALAAGDDKAQAVADSITANDDTVETTSQTAQAELAAEADAKPVEEPGVLESAANWVGQTAKGYATGAVNTVLDTANLVNKGVNAGLDVAGVDYQFQDDMHIQATSETEQHAQNAVNVASIVAGGAGLVRSAPKIAAAADEVAGAAQSALGFGRKSADDVTPTAAVTSGTAAAAARVGDLTADEVAQIQRATNELGSDLYVVGSAAKGQRRNVGTDLPLAKFGEGKAGTRSDIDYATRLDLDDAATRLDLPDVDDTWGVRGVDYLNLDSSPAIRFSPNKPPEFLEQGGGKVWLTEPRDY